MWRPVVYEACILAISLCIAVFMAYHLSPYQWLCITWYSVILYGMVWYMVDDIRKTRKRPQSD